MERGDIVEKLKRVKEALEEVRELPNDQFRKLLEEELLEQQKGLAGLLTQWTVKHVKEE